MRTLDRYIFREVATTCLAVTVVLLVILLSNQLARVLSQAAANDFPRDVVFMLIALTSAGYLTVVIPVGFFLAIMLGLGRLYHCLLYTSDAADERSSVDLGGRRIIK